MQHHDAFLSSVKKGKKKKTRYVAVSVDSVAHRHKLVNVWETLLVYCFGNCTYKIIIL